MKAIYLKEINSFFSSIIGYVVIAVFLLLTGTILMYWPENNIFVNYTASMNLFFDVAPWVFLFLVPAVTMRSLAEERKARTIEILFTKPVSEMQIILGKYFASLTLVLFALLPTLLYYLTLYYLASPVGNIDAGATIGSYIGLIFLAGIYVAIGVFSSSLNDNQIISFIISLVLCFVFYFLIDEFRKSLLISPIDPVLEYLSIYTHYISISKGVIDSRDIVYFASFISLFLVITKLLIERRKW